MTPSRRGTRRVGGAALALLVAALAAAGCGTRSEDVVPRALAPVRLLLLAPNAAEAPIYAAQREGRVREAGLRVTAVQAKGPSAALDALAAGSSDLAVSTEPALLAARGRGAPLVAIAALARGPLSAAIWLPDSGVRGPADLAGRRVGTGGLEYERSFARALAGPRRRAPTVVQVASDPLGALTRRSVAALVGAYLNQEGVALRAVGRRPASVPVTRVGVPAFDEFVLVARTGALARDGDLIRSFLGALARATHDLRRGSQAALAAFAGADPALAGRAAGVALSETMPLILPPAGQPYGYQEPRLWGPFASWMRSAGLLSHAAGGYTNRYLPGAGL